MAPSPASQRSLSNAMRMTAPPERSCAGGQCQPMSSASSPNLFQLTGSSVLNKSDSTASFASNMSPMSPTSDSSFWEWPDSSSDSRFYYRPEQAMRETISVRRLVPRKGGDPFRATSGALGDSRNRYSKIQALTAESSRQLYDPPFAQKDSLLVFQCFDPSSSSSRRNDPLSEERARQKQLRDMSPQRKEGSGGYRNAAKQAIRQDEQDWRVLAKESIAWLASLPKEKQSDARLEIKEWVLSNGLDWEAWVRYCQAFTLPAKQPQQQSSGVGGPSFLGRMSGTPHSTAEHQYTPVPPALYSYNDFLKARGHRLQVSSMQAHIMRQYPSNHLAAPKSKPQPQQALSPVAEPLRRLIIPPQTDEDWRALVVDALAWLQHKQADERPSAMVKMREWVVSNGISWDEWWVHCRRVQQERNRAAVEKLRSERLASLAAESENGQVPDLAKEGAALVRVCIKPWSPERQQVEVELPRSITSTSLSDLSPAAADTQRSNLESSLSANTASRSRLESTLSDDDAVAKASRDKDDKERHRKIKAQKKARDAAMQARAAECYDSQKEKLVQGCNDRWHQATRSYSQGQDVKKLGELEAMINK